jgi:predicted HTH transcriptional regulator
MSDIAAVSIELPDTDSAIRKALEGERRKIHVWAAGVVKDAEARRDSGLRRLDRVESALTGDAEATTKPTRARAKRSRGQRGPTVAAQAERRRQAIHRFLVEQGRALSFSEIRGTLRLSEFSTRSALKRLIEEGKVIRTGTRGTTRYAAKADGSAAPTPGPGDAGTRPGRILELIEDRGSASAEEVAQALRVSREEIQRTCGALVREEEIRMASRDGRPVYTSAPAAA